MFNRRFLMSLLDEEREDIGYDPESDYDEEGNLKEWPYEGAEDDFVTKDEAWAEFNDAVDSTGEDNDCDWDK